MVKPTGSGQVTQDRIIHFLTLSSPAPPDVAPRLRLARRLASARFDKDLTKKELADVAGVTKQFYQAYESGTSAIPSERIEKLAGRLGVTPEWLAFGRGDLWATPAAAPLPAKRLPEVIQAARAGSPRRRAKPG